MMPPPILAGNTQGVGVDVDKGFGEGVDALPAITVGNGEYPLESMLPFSQSPDGGLSESLPTTRRW